MRTVNIPYQSFCWVIGTTSFRTAKLNLKIEEQLLLLNEFYASNSAWNWDSSSQEKYYDFMKEKGFLSGAAQRKDKDAREKTSGLVDIGLISSDRIITEAGKELLEITSSGRFESDNILNISRDSFVYLKQLLKTSNSISGDIVRPFIVTLKALLKLDYLTYDEFMYFIPLISSKENALLILDNIKRFRHGEITFEDVIYSKLFQMANYKQALELFLESEVTEDLICLIGMNRKSRKYDKPYFALYQNIREIFLNSGNDYEALLNATRAINQKPGVLWRNLIFQSTSLRKVRSDGENTLSPECPFWAVSSEQELKEVFFEYLHVFKAMATLADYFDLNRRYFNLTGILIFEDETIKLDLLPKYYFSEVIATLYLDAFSKNDDLARSVDLLSISKAFVIDINEIYKLLSLDLGISITSSEQASTYINDERYRRFNKLIDEKFTDDVLIELLTCFEKREDKRVEELVTDEAAVPTIFEYVLGIIWYKVSNRQGNILDFMKLSLEANLLPKTHAAGGYADIIYEYEACQSYPKHSLLLEATLSDGANQRRMEMEPVSRHLGDYRIRYSNPFDYSLFISTYLDQNVVSDFRYRKIIPYTRDDETITGMKIISINTDTLKKIIVNQIKYSYLYGIFDKFHELPLETPDWHSLLLQEATNEYNLD